MDWIIDLFTKQSFAQTVIIFGLVIAFGIWFGKIKIFGISLGVTWVLFIGLFFSYIGVNVNHELQDFLKEFGLVLFVYTLGLQVGPGFFASLNRNALVTNMLAALVVIFGVATTLILYYLSTNPISIMTGIMSGAVTNTPGLGAAQTTITNLHHTVNDNSLVTLAYAVAYPFGVFGIIISMVAYLKKYLR
jgi:putative transport protein